MSESVILCEGYHDRAFWAGWLTYLGCTDPGTPVPGSTRRRDIHDPWNVKVVGGQYAYLSAGGRFVRVVPCQGKQFILPTARDRLAQRSRKKLLRLVLCIDADIAAAAGSPAKGLRLHDVEQDVRQHADPAASLNAVGEIEVDGGATRVCLIRWEVPDPPHPGLPDQQTLERVVSAAIAAAYPGRAQAVAAWLASRPNPPPPDPKAHAWSYMAGWYAEHGCENFYSNLWKDPNIVKELELRLRASGAWRIAEALAT